MLSCNLAVLLTERNLKISKVSTDTGISRTTLTSLTNNYSQGIQFDTLNALCIYLRVKPADVLVYYPYDFECSYGEPVDEKTFYMNFKICNKAKICSSRFRCETNYNKESNYASVSLIMERPKNISISDAFSIFNNFTEVEWRSVEKILDTVTKDIFFKNINSSIDIDNLEIDYELGSGIVNLE